MSDPNRQFSLKRLEGYNMFTLHSHANASGAKLFELDIDEVLGQEEEVSHFVVDLSEHESINQAWVRALLLLVRDVKKSSFDIRFIGVNTQLRRQMKSLGVDTAFKSVPSLSIALKELGVKVVDQKVDTAFVNPFLNATIQVLKIQAQVEAKSNRVFLKESSTDSLGDISGVIGIVAEKFNGAIVVTFPEKTFLAIMSNMLGETFTEFSSDLADGAGELVNIIFGQAKIELNNLGFGIKTALPSIIVGEQHHVTETQMKKTLVVQFESDVGQFFIEVSTSQP